MSDYSRQHFCIDCQQGFMAFAEWQLRCARCYREYKLRRPPPAVDQRTEKLQRELDTCRAWCQILEARCRMAETALQVQQVGIPMVQWRRLMQLCHPDRHGGSEAAHTATRWLLENRP